jgi:ribosomal protein L40E
MIWRILGTIGAISFFVTGISVLSTPNCLSADIGGGRIIGVTCYDTNYGAFSPGLAAGIMFLIGTFLISLIYGQVLVRFFTQNQGFSSGTRSSNSSDPMEYIKKLDFIQERKKESLGNKNTSEALHTSVKVCDKCNEVVPITKTWCQNCSGTSFTHKKETLTSNTFGQNSEEAMADVFSEKKSEPSKQDMPEYKTCPMCAEEIKFAAKKCRYCQHMMEG